MRSLIEIDSEIEVAAALFDWPACDRLKAERRATEEACAAADDRRDWDRCDELEGAAVTAPATPKARRARNSTRTKGVDSPQDWQTPPELLAACSARFGPIQADLACTVANKVVRLGLTYPEIDSLTYDWTTLPDGVLWLNPPFKAIEPWVAKCAHVGPLRRGLILFLTPASVGANWFADHVWGKATLVLPLLPRLTFVGATDPYPKDCMISVFGPQGDPRQQAIFPGVETRFEPWRWK